MTFLEAIMISEQDRLHFEEGYAAVAMISVETVQARRRGGSYNETGTLVAYFWYCRGLKQGERPQIAAEKPSREPVVTLPSLNAYSSLGRDDSWTGGLLDSFPDAHWREI